MISDEDLLEQLNNNCEKIIICKIKHIQIVYNTTTNTYQYVVYDQITVDINNTTITQRRIQYSIDPTIKVYYNIQDMRSMSSVWVYKEYSPILFDVIEILYNNNFTHPTINHWLECQQTILK